MLGTELFLEGAGSKSVKWLYCHSECPCLCTAGQHFQISYFTALHECLKCDMLLHYNKPRRHLNVSLLKDRVALLIKNWPAKLTAQALKPNGNRIFFFP